MYHEIIYDSYDVALFIYLFTVIFDIVLLTFYYLCIVFVIFMTWFNVLFNFYYSCIVFVSLYKAHESIVLGRHGKTCGSGRVGSIESRVNRLAGPTRLTHIFQTSIFFFFNYKNKSTITCLERMNKIN